MIRQPVLPRGTVAQEVPANLRVMDPKQRMAAALKLVMPEGFSFLEGRSVSQSVLKDYQKRFVEFTEWSAQRGVVVVVHAPLLEAFRPDATLGDRNRVQLAVPEALFEELLVSFMDKAFFDGRPAAFGEKLVASIAFLLPQFAKDGPSFLPRAARALKGWRKLVPAFTRLPLPCGCLMSILADTLQGHWAESVALLTGFVCYLRPYELLSLTVEQVAVAWDFATQAYRVGLVLSPLSSGRPSKANNWEEAVMVDVIPELQHALRYLKVKALAPQERLWPFPPGALQDLLQTTAARQWLEEFRVSLYSLRHGGASKDLLGKTRTLAEVKARGRWQSDSSLKRYAKESKLVEVVSRVPDQVMRTGAHVDKHLAQFLKGYAPRDAQRFFLGAP